MEKIWQFGSYAPRETFDFACLLGQYAAEGACLALSGEMGAGKTLFAQGFACGLGVEEFVTSPTFTLVNQYADGRLPFVHMDLFRLETEEELRERGIEEYFDGHAVALLEWPEVMRRLLPPDCLHIHIEKHYDTESSAQWRVLRLEPQARLPWLEEALEHCENLIS